MGVNFGAMDKYRKPLSAEQWKTCAKSLKVLSNPAEPSGFVSRDRSRSVQMMQTNHEIPQDCSQRSHSLLLCTKSTNNVNLSASSTAHFLYLMSRKWPKRPQTMASATV